MYLEGTITEIFPTQEKTNLTVRKFVLKTNEMYPQEILIDAINKKVPLLDEVSVGDLVKVGINLKGRARNVEGVVKYFNSVEAYKIETDF